MTEQLNMADIFLHEWKNFHWEDFAADFVLKLVKTAGDIREVLVDGIIWRSFESIKSFNAVDIAQNCSKEGRSLYENKQLFNDFFLLKPVYTVWDEFFPNYPGILRNYSKFRCFLGIQDFQ